MGDFYVYVYRDPRKNPSEPIYVGLGQRDRMFQHLGWTHNRHLKRKIARIRKDGLEPVIERAEENLSFEEACAKETELIAKYGRIDLGTGTLCNFTNGGEGTVGYKHTDGTKRLFSEQRKGKTQTEAQYKANCAKRHSEETKAKMSAANKGHRRHTPEQIEAIRRAAAVRVIFEETRKRWSEIRRGRKQTPEHAQKVKEAKAKADAERQESMTDEEWAAYKSQRYVKQRGQKRSEETKAKMREAWVRRKARTATS